MKKFILLIGLIALGGLNIAQAKKYFGKNVFYYSKGSLVGVPSKLIDLTQKANKIKILRK